MKRTISIPTLSGLLSTLVLLAGCMQPGGVPDDPNASTASPLVPATGPTCFDPRSFGAIPDDGADDRAAFTAAVAAASAAGGGTVCITRGVYNLSRDAAVRASLNLSGVHDVRFEGEGPATVIRQSGDAANGDWSLIHLTGGTSGISFAKLTFDGSGTVNFAEQDHLLLIGSGSAAGGTVSDVDFDGVRFTQSRGGDCVRLLGYPGGGEVTGVRVRGSTFFNCDRSGVQVQRGVSKVVIQGSLFTGTGDQDVDFEPSGAGENSEFIIDGNTFLRNQSATNVATAVTLSGLGDERHNRSVFTNNVMIGGRLQAGNVSKLLIAHNIITSGSQPNAPEAVVTFIRRADDLILQGNIFVREAGTLPGAVVSISHNNGFSPRNIVISDNILHHFTPGGVMLFTESVSDLSITGNEFFHSGTDVNQAIAFSARAVINDIEDIVFTGNRIRAEGGSKLLTGVRLAGSPHSVGASVITGNVMRGVYSGVRAEHGTGATIEPPVVSENAITGTVDVEGTPYILAGASIVGVRILAGMGAPGAPAPIGSMFLAHDTGKLYVSTPAGWIEK